MPKLLSKSRYLNGLQCAKLLWHAVNRREEFPEPGAAQQAIFDQGHEVGELAKQLFPGGIEVSGGPLDLQATLSETQRLLSRRVPLYEAAFQHGNAYARADILVPVGKNRWDVHEVKSSSSLKDVNLDDIAFQSVVYRKSGLDVRRCHLVHINGEYERRGEVNPRGLFKVVDVTRDIADRVVPVESRIAEMEAVIARAASPEVTIGPHCSDPYDCPLRERCWDFLPEHNVFDLYRGGKKSWKFFSAGTHAIGDVDAGSLNDKQTIQQAAVQSGEPRLNLPGLRKFLRKLKYPLYFLDFETFATAIPLFDGVRPYRPIPFQFSQHVQREPGGKLEHHGFLAEGPGDPRPDFMARLRPVLDDRGNIVVYNASFEVGRLREGAEFLPEYRSWVKGVEKRIVDLLVPFRAFDYHHPDQHGSASIKAVLPALTGRGYNELTIKEGGTASLEFLRVTYQNVAARERTRMRRALERYCARDTEAMVWIVEELRRLSA